MTDEELKKKISAAIETELYVLRGSYNLHRASEKVLAVAVPEIERRLLEKMREWARYAVPGSGMPSIDCYNEFIERLDAFAKASSAPSER